MSGRPPEAYIWLWVTQGFDGVISMIDNWLTQGVPATPDLKINLTQVRDRLTALINKLP